MSNAPVFIVGTPRSGTTLLASFLCAHRRMHCGMETNFFPHLYRRFGSTRQIEADWPYRAAEHMTSVSLHGQRLHRLYGLTKQDVHTYLASKPPSTAAVLESLTRQSAAAHGKPRWVEQSPKHLNYVSDIRETFPEARIIRMIRDPRDVALSLACMPWAPNSLLSNVYRWVSDQEMSCRFFESDDKTETVLYESLVSDPSGVLRRVCDFLEETFHPEMLDGRYFARHLVSAGEPWKYMNFRPVDDSRVGIWKRQFPPGLLPAAEMIGREQLEKFGYEFSHGENRTLRFRFPSDGALDKLEPVIAKAARAGTRLLPVSARGRYAAPFPRRGLLLVETPSFGPNPIKRIYNLLRFGGDLAWCRLRGRPLSHIDELVHYDCNKRDVYRPARALIRLLTCRVTIDGERPRPARFRKRTRPSEKPLVVSVGRSEKPSG